MRLLSNLLDSDMLYSNVEAVILSRYKSLTVAIVLHGDPKTIYKSIDSIKSEIRNDLLVDVLIIDDGTSPNAMSLLKALEIKTHKAKGCSISYAKNYAIKHSSSDLIMFLDDHMVLKKGWLMEVNGFFNNNENTTGVCGYYSSSFNDANILRDIKRELIYKKNKLNLSITVKNFTTFSTGLCVFDRQKVLQENYYEELFPPDFGGEDFPVSYRLIERGDNLFYTPKIEATHHHGLNWLTFLKKIEIEVRGRFSIYFWAVSNDRTRLPHLQGFLNFPFLFLIFLLTLPVSICYDTYVISALIILSSLVLEIYHTIPVLQRKNCKYKKPLYLHMTAAMYILISDYLSVACFLQYLVSKYKRPFQEVSFKQFLWILNIFFEWEKYKIASMLGLKKKSDSNYVVKE